MSPPSSTLVCPTSLPRGHVLYRSFWGALPRPVAWPGGQYASPVRCGVERMSAWQPRAEGAPFSGVTTYSTPPRRGQGTDNTSVTGVVCAHSPPIRSRTIFLLYSLQLCVSHTPSASHRPSACQRPEALYTRRFPMDPLLGSRGGDCASVACGQGAPHPLPPSDTRTIPIAEPKPFWCVGLFPQSLHPNPRGAVARESADLSAILSASRACVPFPA